ncbi:DUF2235 domain-containing protein [Rhodococcus rhodochrous]|uniref:DUF2235 domain-containing protein n=3 Tax=Rhodococcus rhodochrous TaxID=1829 RepID=UPI001E4E0626|nr:DUF2235 domain-containing protein [Rhodococcus rhodochrous]MCD2098448.1 DUF2235 domain-containing protein [Rhodococcus rhodochrous]MCD2123072.1 DUF2235 domain-containing protein [Rhodococcus rhodochrous]MCQ4135976.1 DUF2235 domain-containing protein [Rhodococcus rhodochrous]
MPKNIIYCADGTWNSGKRTNTNVHRFHEALASTPTQVKIYDSGVGTEGNLLSRLRGGAFGRGLVENVREGYGRIADVFEEGDRLFLIGFSRGAYTARSLGGMIAYCGLPSRRPTGRLVEQAFRAYRNRTPEDKKWTGPSDGTRMVDGHIEMIGVWDTVGTLGIPGALFGRLDQKDYGFLDTRLHRDVKAGYHALSLDERRRQFPPTLWEGPAADGQTIEQVWFAGVHCDVGGGFPTTSLADISLAWMLSNAERHGVEIDPAVAATYPALLLDCTAALGPVNESWNPLWGFPRRRSVGSDARVADSVVFRVTMNSRYSPPLTMDNNPRRLSASYRLASVVRI